jgi:chromosome segregation protein
LEVKTKVHGLNLQLKRFKRHENMTKYLKESEISLAFLKIVRYEELARPLYKKIEEFKRIRKSKETKESIHEAKLVRLREVYQQQDRELISLQDELKTLEEERDEYHQNVLVYTEQKRSAESTLERLHLEKKSNDNKRDKLSTQINGIEQEVESLNPHVEAKLVEYKGKKQTFDSVEREYEKAQASVEKLQSKRWEEQRKVSDQESLFKRTESLIEEKTKLVQKLEKNLESMEKIKLNIPASKKSLNRKKPIFRINWTKKIRN